jgi:hypothetical protein
MSSECEWQPSNEIAPTLTAGHVSFEFQFSPDFALIPREWWAHHRIRTGWTADFAWIRRNHHHLTCRCAACRFLDMMNTDSVTDWVARIVGNPVKLGDMHCALMEPGHCVNTHDDRNKGDYAVVWYFNNCDGGELMLPNTCSFVQPKKNTAVLFTVPQPHYVKSSKTDRYSCTTWFSKV